MKPGGGSGDNHADSHVPVSAVVVLTSAAIGSGLDIRGALLAVSRSLKTGDNPEVARDIEAVANRLRTGYTWTEAWAGSPAKWLPLERALRPSWIAGAAPRSSLDAAAVALAQRARRRGDTEMAELSVAMALPMTLCLLPAFALVGIVPMIIAVVGAAGLAIGT